MATPPTNLDDYSASSTIILFDRPVPLLRGPIPAGSADDPSSGPFVLAFRDARSCSSAYSSCESQITQQCDAAARIGCSITASSICRPPWWKALTLRGSKPDFADRARCEEREMAICVEASKESYRRIAREKCSAAFRGARIALRDWKVDRKEASRLIRLASLPSAEKMGRLDLIGLNGLVSSIGTKSLFEVTNCRGSDVLGFDSSLNGK